MVPRVTSAVAVALMITACGGRTVVTAPRGPISPEQMAELWIDPGPEPRDLFWGVGGQKYAPSPDAIYKVTGKDDLGFSVSFDVEGPDGLGWSAKVGPEAQTEVVMSRILWGLGYHQPPLYYLPSWNADEKGDLKDGEPRRESEARFRPKLAELKRLDDYWFWADNPFSGTRQLKGLLAMMLMLNSTDLKDDNNSIYVPNEPWDGAERWFLVRDIGAALGDTGKLFPRRNWLDGFERNAFITSISGDHLEFQYKGRHQELLSMITPADVQWASQQMARLTDAQWRDAFRAGNYADSMADRYIARIKEKIADGLALRVDRRVRAGTY